MKFNKKTIIKTTIGLAVLGVTGTAFVIGYKLFKGQKMLPLFDFKDKEIEEVKKDETE